MLQEGDRIVVGVSGGADSVCLFFLLHHLREKIPFSLSVVHVHHGIRAEAQEDAAYVEALCRQLGVPFFQENVDVPELARREGVSLEEAGRKARYGAFVKYAGIRPEEGDYASPVKENGSVKIALAHHMGDRAETLLFHLFRGSGIKGLGSIQPIRPLRRESEGISDLSAAADSQEITVIRPLLCLEREEIEAYLAENGISYCQDKTNLEDAYARNRIRHHVLPYAEEEICSGAVRHLNQAAEQLSETEQFLVQQTKAARAACVKVAANVEIQVSPFLEMHPLLQKRLLLELLLECSPHHKDVGAVHVEALQGLFQGESGKRLDLPFGTTARREYEKVILERAEGTDRDLTWTPVMVPAADGGNPVTVTAGKYRFTFRSFPYKKSDVIPQKNYTKWFDYDKIKDTLSVRTRGSGDYFMIRGGEGQIIRKTIKDYMVTEKIPRSKRQELPLLAEDRHVLWIPGHRISESYKMDENTKTVLEVELQIRQDEIGESEGMINGG